MSVFKVVELIGSSKTGFDDAVNNVVKEASKTIKNIKSVYVKDMQVKVVDNKISEYRVNTKVSFRVE